MSKLKEIYEKDIEREIQGVIKVDDENFIKQELEEYVVTDELLKTSPCKFWGAFPSKTSNDFNLCIAGHNYDNDKFFSKIKDLKTNDKIYIYDTFDNQYVYSVIKNYEVKPDDLSPVYHTTTGSFELTLVTCNNFNGNRIIIKAKIEDG